MRLMEKLCEIFTRRYTLPHKRRHTYTYAHTAQKIRHTYTQKHLKFVRKKCTVLVLCLLLKFVHQLVSCKLSATTFFSCNSFRALFRFAADFCNFSSSNTSTNLQ